MRTLTRKITESDIKDKGFPFECENCGSKPIPQDMIDHQGSCSICGDSVIAYTIDTADFILKQETREARLAAEFSDYKRSAMAMNDQLTIEIHRLVEVLNELWEEYEDRKCQFGDHCLWEKHEDKEGIERIRIFIKTLKEAKDESI